jgi:hypothetical protein
MIEASEEILQSSAFPGRQGRLMFVYLARAPRRVKRARLASLI